MRAKLLPRDDRRTKPAAARGLAGSAYWECYSKPGLTRTTSRRASNEKPGQTRFFLILAVVGRRQDSARRATRGASPTLPSPTGRDLLTLQAGSPDMSEATVLFADVSGSKRLIETQGDEVALKAIARCIERLRTAAESTGGQVVKTIGDEVMVLFPTPDAAVQAAAKMHESINALPAIGDTKLGVHVGFH